MARHSFIRVSKLHDVAGRIDYISNPARQEFLYGVRATCDTPYWQKLANENQLDFHRSGSLGKCIEARELIIALPEEYQYIKPEEILDRFTGFFKDKYGVECIAALHHNKRKTNYHIHLIFSERKELPEKEVKIASRNMFYDEKGKHRRTKKEITDDNGELRKGCYIIPKGKPYEGHHFEPKEKVFKGKAFLQEVKEVYTELINEQMKDSEKLEVFKKDSIFLPMKKIGKNNPKADIIMRNNYEVAKWNSNAVYLSKHMPEDHIKEIKKKEIVEPVREAKAQGVRNDFVGIISRATKILNRFYKEWRGLRIEDRPEARSDRFYRLLDYCRVKISPLKNKGWER